MECERCPLSDKLVQFASAFASVVFIDCVLVRSRCVRTPAKRVLSTAAQPRWLATARSCRGRAGWQQTTDHPNNAPTPTPLAMDVSHQRRDVFLTWHLSVILSDVRRSDTEGRIRATHAKSLLSCTLGNNDPDAQRCTAQNNKHKTASSTPAPRQSPASFANIS